MPGFFIDKIKLYSQKRSKIRFIINILQNRISRALKLPTAGRYPVILNIEPTTLCNLRCPTCPNTMGILKRGSGSMSFDMFRKIMDEAGDYAATLILFGYGEPFLCRDIIKMIRYAVDKKIWTWTSTNGSFFKDDLFVKEIIGSGLHHMLVCLDGISQDTLSFFRKRADYQEIVTGIRKVVETKRALNSKYPYLDLQFIDMKHNHNEIERVRSFAREMGFDRFSVKSVGISPGYPNFKELSEKYLNEPLEESGLYKKNADGTFDYCFEPTNACNFLYSSALISWDGFVLPCCYDFKGEYQMGDLNREKLADIWNNDKYSELRNKIKSGRNSNKMCRYCPEDRVRTYKDIVSLRGNGQELKK